MDSKEVIPFVVNVPPNTTGSLKERIKADATVEEVNLRFYPGQQRDLEVRPKLQRTGNRVEDLITYPKGANDWIAGDDDNIRLDISVTAQLDDEIVIFYSNKDTVNIYTLVVYVTVDYREGKNNV